jgi:hypothetical protein
MSEQEAPQRPGESEHEPRAWWLEEDGSDALMALRAKLRLWLERAREQSASPEP